MYLSRLLHEAAPEERQLDLGLLVDQYQQILLSLTAKQEVNLATLVEGLSLLTRTLQVRTLDLGCYNNGTQFVLTKGYPDKCSSGRLLFSPPYNAYLS